MKSTAKSVRGLVTGCVFLLLVFAHAQEGQALKAGKFQVAFSSVGRVAKFNVTQSTGSAVFDQALAKQARTSWIGQPGVSETVVIEANAKSMKPDGDSLPRPPYPAAAMMGQQMGSGVCLVTFDASGHAASQVMTKSTGWLLLDRNTLAFAQANWTGRPNKTIASPITYQLR